MSRPEIFGASLDDRPSKPEFRFSKIPVHESGDILDLLPLLIPGNELEVHTRTGSLYSFKIERVIPPTSTGDNVLVFAKVIQGKKYTSGDEVKLAIVPGKGEQMEIDKGEGRESIKRTTSPVEHFTIRPSESNWRERIAAEAPDTERGGSVLRARLDKEIERIRTKITAIQERILESAYTVQGNAILDSGTIKGAVEARKEADRVLIKHISIELEGMMIAQDTLGAQRWSNQDLPPRTRYDLFLKAHQQLTEEVTRLLETAERIADSSSTNMPTALANYRELRNEHAALQEIGDNMKKWIEQIEGRTAKNLAELWSDIREGSIVSFRTEKGTEYSLQIQNGGVDAMGRMVLTGVSQIENGKVQAGETLTFLVPVGDSPEVLVQVPRLNNAGFRTSPAKMFTLR